jgi:hypothetical protein
MRILGRPHPLLAPVLTLLLLLLVAFTAFGCGSPASTKSVADHPQSMTVPLPDGLAFQLPSGWATMKSAAAADAASSNEDFADMADTMGMTADQLERQVAALDVFLTAPRARDGFLDNVNALHTPGPLPTAGALELQYRAMGASAIEVADHSTELGTAHVTTYDLKIGANQVHGGSVAVAHGDNVVVITASTSSTTRTEKLVAQILDTVAARG